MQRNCQIRLYVFITTLFNEDYLTIWLVAYTEIYRGLKKNPPVVGKRCRYGRDVQSKRGCNIACYPSCSICTVNTVTINSSFRAKRLRSMYPGKLNIMLHAKHFTKDFYSLMSSSLDDVLSPYSLVSPSKSWIPHPSMISLFPCPTCVHRFIFGLI